MSHTPIHRVSSFHLGMGKQPDNGNNLSSSRLLYPPSKEVSFLHNLGIYHLSGLAKRTTEHGKEVTVNAEMEGNETLPFVLYTKFSLYNKCKEPIERAYLVRYKTNMQAG